MNNNQTFLIFEFPSANDYHWENLIKADTFTFMREALWSLAFMSVTTFTAR